MVVAFFSSINTELSVLFFSITTIVTAKFLADITVKVTQLFNGIQIQSPITVAKEAAVVAEAPVTPIG